MKNGYGYSHFHDDSPDEILADVDAYDSLIENLEKYCDEDNFSIYYNFILNRKIDRITKAHSIDEEEHVLVPDFRLKAYDSLLERENLSATERQKVTQIRDSYLEILNEAKIKGIDIYARTLGWLKNFLKKTEKTHNMNDNDNKKITPSDALTSALKGTSATKADEAKGVEQTVLNPENIKEGETKDD